MASKTPDILHVPYRGAGPGLIDLVSGVVPMMTPNITGQVLSFHRAGKVRILAVCAPARIAVLAAIAMIDFYKVPPNAGEALR